MGSGSVRPRAEIGSFPITSGRRPMGKHHAGGMDRSRFDRRQTTRRVRSSSSDRSPPQTKKDGFDVHPTQLTSRRMAKVSRAKPVRAYVRGHVPVPAPAAYVLAARNKKPSAPGHSDDMSQTTRRTVTE